MGTTSISTIVFMPPDRHLKTPVGAVNQILGGGSLVGVDSIYITVADKDYP
jgi:hypothetical protein